MESAYPRRDILKLGAMAGLGLRGPLSTADDAKPFRVGLVGVGTRGTAHLSTLLETKGVQIPAVCDINEERVARAQDLVEKAGQPKPAAYSSGETDFRRLCDRNDINLVLNSTPWEWHAPAALYAMRAGKHTAVEVPVAITVEDCWELVETAEKTGKQCIMLENACYMREVLLVLNMIRAGLLGEILYAEGGYLHDLRTVKFNLVPHAEPWRLEHAVRRNGNLYPTHPLGPIAWWMDINRGDRLTHLVSHSSRALSLKEFAARRFGPDDHRARRDYKLGDWNTTLIHTEKGKTITLLFDTNTPRPQEIMARVQGTNGVVSGMLQMIYVEGRSPGDRWEPLDEYKREFDPKLWRGTPETAFRRGHGDIDEKQTYRLIKNFREGRPPDMDVYDAAAWSVVCPLSEASVARRGAVMDIPDFTRGKWKTRPPIGRDEIA
jgi:predicted dehydrogenase